MRLLEKGTSMLRPIAPLASLALGACVTSAMLATAPRDLNIGVCMPLDQIDDYDLKRSDLSTLPGICMRMVTFNSLGLDWRLQVFEKPGYEGPLWLVPHDNENSGFDSGLYALSQYGGAMVAIDTDGERYNKGRDPNRIFGLENDVCHLGGGPLDIVFTDAVLGFRHSNHWVVALHSNDEGYWGDGMGGQGNVSIRIPDSNYRRDFVPEGDAIGASPDDTLIYMAGLAFPPSDPGQPIKALTGQKINVIFERVVSNRNDCSFSNFAALHNLGVYFNVEVVHRDVASQKTIVDFLMAHYPQVPGT